MTLVTHDLFITFRPVFVPLAGLKRRPNFVGVGRGQLLQVGHEFLDIEVHRVVVQVGDVDL